MSPLTETVLFVFSLVALGYLAGLTGYLRPASGEGISDFAVSVAMPLLLFQTMVTADFHGVAPWPLWGAYFTAAAITWAAGHLVITRIFGRDARAGVVGGVSSAFSNIVLLGAPFILGIFGPSGFEVLSLLVSVHLPIMMMASIVLFEMFGRGSGEHVHPLRVIRSFLRRLFMNPLIIGIVLGLAWRLSGVPLPGLAMRLVDALADTAGPVALFAMGLSLRRFGISGNVRPALALSALKLFLMPALVLAFVWLLGLPPLTAKVAVVVAALPSGINSYLIAVQFNTGQALASNQMTIATACAAITTAFWLTVVLHVFG
ncbi:AEC family transporter [Mesorhizobium sp. CO1-1-7]|uniref:AEC family transporter n=1 Tax=unclassified Mesorhizobium TaxID=325217 RepID=UPI001126DC20|nr:MULTISPECIES: AEC family transporter [unclassified Mesorhizobium]MBZ9932099.1 AEC family transporter [Mesorhizobium sp. BR1-1-5]MBZ9698829.1 AEC family transporter [Mesorhizobium sp. CO1-1-9]MBZ9745283.1 AEC family transporter [Mesorhizobium sp. CO1-1-7]MBZ9909982.1 AEC family transporter [Mesorhizobium sp. BR115XR7A]TPK17327.1 AEC family transporter [Mesorhizobium sp. B2-5-7]